MTASLLQQSFEPSTRLFNLTTGPEAVEYGTMLITHIADAAMQCFCTGDIGRPVNFVPW
jgi:hypothetical protein